MNFTTWTKLAYLWPIFITILGLSFLPPYAFAKKPITIIIGVFLEAIPVRVRHSRPAWDRAVAYLSFGDAIFRRVERAEKSGGAEDPAFVTPELRDLLFTLEVAPRLVLRHLVDNVELNDSGRYD